MLILKGDFFFFGRLHRTSEMVQQKRSISKACFISMLKSGFPLLVLKGTKDIPVTALCDGRGRSQEEECGTLSAPSAKALAAQVMLPIVEQRKRCRVCVGRSKTSEIFDRRGIWLLSNTQNCTELFLQKKKILWAKKKSIIFDFCSIILYNITWRLLLVSPALHREGRSHSQGSLLCWVPHIHTVIPNKS